MTGWDPESSTGLRFAVLGPVRGWVGDRELGLGAPQQRAVLAMLLLAEGRQVTLEALLCGLWEGEPPLAAVGVVRTYVSRLRHALKAGGGGPAGELIRSDGTGYVMPVPVRGLDLDVFRRTTEDARRLAAEDPASKARAAALLGAAEGLAQGEPLADIPGPYARSQRVRITELQLAAAEERLALEIELGGHAAAAAELHTLLRDHPMRERLTELLMLALYRSGRQVDALAAFDGARRLLGEEFGISPGPQLREMQQRILQADESLIVAAPQRADGGAGVPQRAAALPGPAVAPAQLPGDLPVFTGRQGELARLGSFLTGDAAAAGVLVTAIDGIAGVGKTALAVRWARQVAGQFPDGQLYVDLGGFGPDEPVAAGEALRGFLEALGIAPQLIPRDLEGQASLYRSMLHGRRVLVLLDNARDIEQVRPLLPGSAGCLVVVTSRSRLLGLVIAHGARTVALEPLAEQEARQLLAARTGAARLDAEPRAVDEIIGRCAGLPLAIAVIAARANVYGDLPLSEIASELRDAPARLEALSADDATADVRAALSWSYSRLSESARRLFRLLSVNSGPDISRNAAASLVGLPSAQARQLLSELASTGLVTEHRPGRIRWHDLTQAYATELSAAHDTPADRHDALRRLLDYYLRTSNMGRELLGASCATLSRQA